MNQYFQFKQFRINQHQCAMKVATDSCLFGAWVASVLRAPSRVLDIGAGTGLLSLMLAQQCDAFIEAVEIEEQCYQQLAENVAASPWHSRIKCVLNDIRTLDHDQPFDLIISNPPFYEKQLQSPHSATNAARHSKDLTLDALLQVAKQKLSADGMFAVLLPYYRHEELVSSARNHELYPIHICFTRHSPHHPWYRTMVMFSRTETGCIDAAIDIRNEAGEYSEGFSALMHDYYLG